MAGGAASSSSSSENLFVQFARWNYRALYRQPVVTLSIAMGALSALLVYATPEQNGTTVRDDHGQIRREVPRFYELSPKQ